MELKFDAFHFARNILETFGFLIAYQQFTRRDKTPKRRKESRTKCGFMELFLCFEESCGMI